MFLTFNNWFNVINKSINHFILLYRRPRLLLRYLYCRLMTGQWDTVGIAGPCYNNDTRDGGLLSQINHPDRCFDVEVIQHCTAVNAWVDVIMSIWVVIDRVTTRLVLVTASVALELSATVDEWVLLVRQVLHCIHVTKTSIIRNKKTLKCKSVRIF